MKKKFVPILFVEKKKSPDSFKFLSKKSYFALPAFCWSDESVKGLYYIILCFQGRSKILHLTISLFWWQDNHFPTFITSLYSLLPAGIVFTCPLYVFLFFSHCIKKSLFLHVHFMYYFCFFTLQKEKLVLVTKELLVAGVRQEISGVLVYTSWCVRCHHGHVWRQRKAVFSF
jgi:hypothetical protein